LKPGFEKIFETTNRFHWSGFDKKKYGEKIKMADFEFSPIFSYGNSVAREKLQIYPFVKMQKDFSKIF
jgi:hypothetical protein